LVAAPISFLIAHSPAPPPPPSPSFPTRRSSDLLMTGRINFMKPYRPKQKIKPSSYRLCCNPLIPIRTSDMISDLTRFILRIHMRSEEHTSELQSRLDLVCRLLLDNREHQRDAPP